MQDSEIISLMGWSPTGTHTKNNLAKVKRLIAAIDAEQKPQSEMRDVFIAAALIGVVAHQNSNEYSDEEIANQSVELANAVMQARNK